MNKKPVSLGVVILFGVGSVFWIVYTILELLYGAPDLLRLLRLVVAGIWVMGFFGMTLRYKKQKRENKE